MKFLKHFNVIAVAASLIFLGSCLQEENPCPDAVITVDVDSSNFTYTITAEGLEDIIYEWSVNGNKIEKEELDDLRDNILDFQFEPGTYNICVTAESELCGGSIEVCKEVTILADPCPWLEFEKEKIHWNKYIFEASFEHKNDILYTWYVDGDSIETAPFGEDRWHAFDYSFEPGTHTVCIKQVDDRCEGNEYCVEINIEEPVCPTLRFEADKLDGNTYLFEANFEGKNDVQYKWYVGEDIIDKENYEGITTDHKLEKEFAPGTYSVCLVAHVDGCNEAEYCQEIVVENPCKEVTYIAERDGDNLAYNFTANFDGKTDTHYFWEIYVGEDKVGSEAHEPESDDHNFYWQFEAGVEYKVCLRQDDCPDAKFCETFIINE